MKNKHIYFLSSYVCLQTFFSIYDIDYESLIVCEKNDLYEFIKTLTVFSVIKVNDDEIRQVIFPSKKRVDNYLKQYNKVYEWISNCKVTVHIFCQEWTLGFFFFLNDLTRKSNVDIEFINCEAQNIYKNAEIRSTKDLVKYIKYKYIKFTFGLNICPIGTSNGGLTFRWLHGYRESDPIIKCSWSEIADKFNLYKYRTHKKNKKILFIHQNLYFLDSKRAYSIINLLLNTLQKKNYDIYIKLHPNQQNQSELLNKGYYFLPKVLPVELIEKEYDAYITVSSLGIKNFLDCKNCFIIYKAVTCKKNIDDQILRFIENNFTPNNIVESETEILDSL